MKVSNVLENEVLQIKVEGRIDSSTHLQLREELEKMEFARAKEVILDFKDVEYISSAGLRELLIIRKRTADHFRLINVNDEVYDILEMTGFSNILHVEKSNNVEVDYTKLSFKAFLEYKLKTLPDKVILSDDNFNLTYKDIDEYSDCIAEDLMLQGVKKGSHVAICGLNSINWVLTFFAIQKIGALAVLVNPTLSVPEIQKLTQIGDITHFCFGIMPILLTNPAEFMAGIMDKEKSYVTHVYDITKPITKREVNPFAKGVLSSINVLNDDPGVMIFTSGSTGIAKGVLLSSFNIMTSSSCGKELGASENDSSLLLLPLFHIFGLCAGLFANLMNDSSVVIPKTVRTNDILFTLKNKKCTIMHSVPTILLALINNPNFSEDIVKCIRHSGVGGAPISETQMLLLNKKFPNTQFYVLYGLSEMAPVSYTKRGDSIERITKSIGMPSSFVKVKIQNPETLADNKNYEVGEIIVQGDSLMSGYYKTPIEKQDFDEKGWFHTGDLGFMDDDGYLHFAGRKKEIIIKGGENILPNEVASAISEEACVANVQVFGVPHEFWGEQVAAAILLKPGYAFNKEEFLSHVATKLAKIKVPDHVYVFEEFPTLANGKTDLINLKKMIIAKIKEEA